MENNKDKKLSNHYQDYKYEYKGYEEYIKKHRLDKETIKEDDQEEIVHDHNYQFDFNNPNEHQHDYSFDFPKKEEPPKVTTDRYYNVQPRPTYNNTSQFNNMNNQKKNVSIIVTVFVIFFAIIFISTLISVFEDINMIENTYEHNSDYDYDYDYDYDNFDDYENKDDTEQDDILDITIDYSPVDAYCNALSNNNYTLLLDYIPENSSNSAISQWRTRILINSENSRKVSCGTKTPTPLEDYELNVLKYVYDNAENELTEAVVVEVEKLVDNYNNGQKIYLVIGQINDDWYLLDEQYR